MIKNTDSEAHKIYLLQRAQAYKLEIDQILNSSKKKVIPGREYCENCDPRFRLLQTPEKTRNNLLLQQQLYFEDGHIIFKRTFQPEFQILNPLYFESQQQTHRIAQKLTKYPNILKEFNFKFEKDFNTKKLMFLDQYLKVNNVKPGSYKAGFLPLLMAFNKHSKSTPCRMVQCPNRQAICKYDTNQDLKNCDIWDNKTKKLLSYNECIKSYDLSLLTPNKITVNHLLTMAPIFADLSDAFGHLILHPETELSCQIFV